MKNMFHSKKFRYGSVSVALVAVIIAAVILVNAIFTALCRSYMWFVDMTPNRMYTLSDSAVELLDTMNKGTEVTITFCSEADVLDSNEPQRYPHRTALEISKRFDNVKIRYVDIYTNPSAVSGIEGVHTSYDINSETIILESVGAPRVYTLESMYVRDDSDNIIGYRGEQVFVSGILSVTKTEQPVACFISNHGELENPNVPYLKSVMEGAGCKIVDFDLSSKEPIPEDCRIMVVVDPQSDFSGRDDEYTSDEIKKLEEFLSNQKSLMVFFDNATPYLPNFETFLASWGIGIARDAANESSALLVRDYAQSLDDNGLTAIGDYVKEGGLGASMTKSLWNTSNPKSVLFPYSAVMYNTFPAKYNENGFWQADSYQNGRTRIAVDVFTSSNSATAEVGGTTPQSDKQLTDLGLNLNADKPFSYMKLAYETQQNDVYSYVLACSSTDFGLATQNSGYGNHTALAYATSMLGRDNVAVSIDTKYFSDTEISNVTAAEANIYTVVLTLVPTIVILAAGTVVIIRRRFS